MPLPDDVLDALFLTARTHSKWLPGGVEDATLARLYDLLKMAPTSANGSPARFVFVKSAEAKRRLAPALSPGNLAKTLAAPVTAIVATDTLFYEKLPKLSPHVDAKSWFAPNPALAEETAFRNSSLQGAYLILAARALGLDCGPMSGFDKAQVNAAFFAGTGWTANFLVNLGHGDPTGVHARAPRLDFDEACRIA